MSVGLGPEVSQAYGLDLDGNDVVVAAYAEGLRFEFGGELLKAGTHVVALAPELALVVLGRLIAQLKAELHGIRVVEGRLDPGLLLE
jgi:hypothetical protein